MKVLISADIEGTAGINVWNEANKAHSEYVEFRSLMTNEVIAACRGALEAGATEIIIKDAHATARNIILENLPKEVSIVRGWSGHPFSMVYPLDESFDAVVFTGYHGRAGGGGNPLSHTFNARTIFEMRLNGVPASEFICNALSASLVGVPIAFLSGDKAICEEVNQVNSNIATLAVTEGVGPSSISISPALSVELIEENVRKSLTKDLSKNIVELANEYVFEIDYKNPESAYKASWYPGVKQIGPQSIQMVVTDFFEIMRALNFINSV